MSSYSNKITNLACTSENVDVVVVTWNTESLTIRCLYALREVLSHEAIENTVWVVDNCSTDNTVSEIRKLFPEVRLIEHHFNAGFSVANNLAIRKGSASFVLLLNSDAFLRPGALSAMLGFLKLQPEVSAIGPQLVMDNGEVQHSVLPITNPINEISYLAAFHFPPFSHIFRRWFQRARNRFVAGSGARRVPLLSAACLLLRRSVFEQVGLLPEDRFLYSEEDDLFIRMRRSNLAAIYFPEAQALHLCGASSDGIKSTITSNEHFHRSRLRFLYKHYPNAQILVYLSHCFFFSWSLAFARIKQRIRGTQDDFTYVSVYRFLLQLNRDEYRNATQDN